MEFFSTLEQDEDGFWVAECPAIPGCHARSAGSLGRGTLWSLVRAGNARVEDLAAAVERQRMASCRAGPRNRRKSEQKTVGIGRRGPEGRRLGVDSGLTAG